MYTHTKALVLRYQVDELTSSYSQSSVQCPNTAENTVTINKHEYYYYTDVLH